VLLLTGPLELLNAARLTAVPNSQRVEHKFLKFYLGWQEQARWQLLNAKETFTGVPAPEWDANNSQTNVQINLAATSVQTQSFVR
jgi:hypothetical protein